ncbi:MAG TPA: VOC family protein [Streptosporangiaceae bacterium]|jgi:catechol 2,3-dioxygenase-like lactoylglutathione lyase family enzyme
MADTKGTGVGELIMVTLDCARPPAQAEFYSRLLGWDILHSQDEYSMIGNGHASIGFGQIPGYTPPAWPDPDGVKRYHIDTYVDDLDEAEAECLKLGATKPEFQPGETWRVLLDPDGQPFDICQRS